MSSTWAFRRSVCWLGLAGVLVLGADAAAQHHGVRIGKSCAPDRCVGDTVDCLIEIGHDDTFGDTLEILEAFDVIDPKGPDCATDADALPGCRIPAVGNLPIVAVSGNTTCTIGGSLPCLICPGGVTCGGNPPFSNDPGVVTFQSNEYVIQPGDPLLLENRGNVRTKDLCDGCGSPPCPGCSMLPSLVQFTAGTTVLTCEDNNDCTTNVCVSGTRTTPGSCTFDPDCENPMVDCPTGDPCLVPVCDELGCCDSVPLCPGGVCCAGGASCDDMDPCTTDECVDGCCVNTPFCVMDEDCEDQFFCTIDTCVDGCCEHVCQTPDITCPDDITYECDNVGDFGNPTVDDSCSKSPDVECTEETTPGESPQEYTVTRTCTVTNDCGNSDECTYNIFVLDTTPPEVTCPPDKECECNEPCDYGDPIVEDNCDPDPHVEIEVVQTTNDCTTPPRGISPPPKYTVTRTITVTDGQGETRGGNSVVCEQTINIFDRDAPVIVNCPPSFARCDGDDLNFTPPGCTDNCGPCEVNCTRSDGQPMNAPVNPPITITCTATDECDTESAPCSVNVTQSSTCGDIIPTTSEWGLAVLALLFLIGGKVYFARQPIAAR